MRGALLPVLIGLLVCTLAQAQRAGDAREFNGRFGASRGVAEAEATDRVIIKWRSNARTLASADVDLAELAGRSGVRVQRLRAIGNGMQVLRLEREQSGEELVDTLQRLRSDPNVELVESDRRLHPHTFTPTDPLYSGQWYLQNTQISGIRANDAWDIARGGASAASSGTVIAVIDTGVRFDHPDLQRANAAGKLLPGYDFVSSDSPGNFSTANDGDGWDADPSDPGDNLTAADLQLPIYRNRGCGSSPSNSSWHGTRVAGMIAANTNNGVGVAGGAFNAWVLPIRALGKCGGFDSDILAAMYWAAGLAIPSFATGNQTVPPTNPYPAHVINMSLGATGACSSTYAAAVSAIAARGVLITVSAGNEGAITDTPANCPGVLGVGGLRHVGTKVGYSNLGPEVAISAPAGNCVNTAAGSPCLFSLDTTSNNGTTTPGGTDYTSQTNPNVGTSFSSPLAAATAGLMHEVNARLSPAMMIARVRSSATPFPTSSADAATQPPVCHLPTSSTDIQDSECLCTSGLCGAGMLNAAAAVAAAQRPVAVILRPASVAAGSTIALDGSGSAASCNRTVSSYSWAVVGTGGSVTSTNTALSSILAPASGSTTVRLTVTDNAGATDSTDLVLTASSATTSAATLLAGNACATPILVAQATAPTTPVTPSAPASSGGGGGAFGAELLLLAGLGVARAFTRRRAACTCRSHVAR